MVGPGARKLMVAIDSPERHCSAPSVIVLHLIITWHEEWLGLLYYKQMNNPVDSKKEHIGMV